MKKISFIILVSSLYGTCQAADVGGHAFRAIRSVHEQIAEGAIPPAKASAAIVKIEQVRSMESYSRRRQGGLLSNAQAVRYEEAIDGTADGGR